VQPLGRLELDDDAPGDEQVGAEVPDRASLVVNDDRRLDRDVDSAVAQLDGERVAIDRLEESDA
jgi:hypothetical protein